MELLESRTPETTKEHQMESCFSFREDQLLARRILYHFGNKGPSKNDRLIFVQQVHELQ